MLFVPISPNTFSFEAGALMVTFRSIGLQPLVLLLFSVSQWLLAEDITPTATVPEMTTSSLLPQATLQPSPLPTLVPATYDYPASFP